MLINLPNWKRYLVSILSAILALGIFIHMRGCDKRKDQITAGLTLGPNEKEKVIVDPFRKHLTVVTPTYTKVLDLPDRPSSITVMKDNSVKVTAPQYGTELMPFLAVSYDLIGGKIDGGFDLFYWKKLDFGGGIAVNPVRVQDTTLFLGFSLFVWDNSSIFFGVNNKISPMFGVKVRI